MIGQHTDVRKNLVLPLLLFLFLATLMPGLPGVLIDMRCWEQWAIYIRREGLSNAYGSGTNYPPFYQYVLFLFGKLASTPENISRYIGYLRLFTLVAEFWGLWIVYRWLGRRIDYSYVLLCSMLNIAYAYDTMIWGQLDGILAALAVAALYYLSKGRIFLSTAMMVLALNMKLQAIIFVPLWGLLMIAELQQSRRWRLLSGILPVMLIVQAILILPFTWGRGGAGVVWRTVAGLADTYPWITIHAFNMWYWIAPDAGPGNPDNVPLVFGISYYHAGLLLFSLALLLVLMPVLRHTLRTIVVRGHLGRLRPETIWLTAALSALVFFFFNTRMHERYAHPAFIFITAYAFYRRQFGLYALFSLAFFLNIEREAEWLRLRSYDLFVFDPRFVAVLFAGCIVWAGVLLYRSTTRPAMGSAAVASQPESSFHTER